MQLESRQKPQPGEKWVYLTGQLFEIIDVKADPQCQEEWVVYREHNNPAPLWSLDMDDFMATLKEENDVLIPFFRKV